MSGTVTINLGHVARGLAAGDPASFDALIYIAALDQKALQPALDLALKVLADYA